MNHASIVCFVSSLMELLTSRTRKIMDDMVNMPHDDFESLFLHPLPDESFDFPHAIDDGGFSELSQALAVVQAAPSHNDNLAMSSVFKDLSNHSTNVSTPLTPGTPVTRPKIGSRFSRETIQTLKQWLTAHHQHPYPTEDEMITLQQRTSLNKAQLTNWFANARRRGKFQGTRSTSQEQHYGVTGPVDIIHRPGTPALCPSSRHMDPMQRWVESPPEHEPAAVGDIARAMASNTRESLREFPSVDFPTLWISVSMLTVVRAYYHVRLRPHAK
jgi:hypothetical protein